MRFQSIPACDLRSSPKRRGPKTKPRDAAYFDQYCARFHVKVILGAVPEFAPHLGECWYWTGSMSPQGYGAYRHYIDRRPIPAHRAALLVLYWEETRKVLELPKGHSLTVDHLCRVKRCVRPSHLEWVTQQENMLRVPGRGDAVTCAKGHEWNAANTRIQPGGGRRCRACVREFMAARYQQQKAAGTIKRYPRRAAA